MEELYPRIEDYLDNALTDAERAAFEADAQADPALAAALSHVREARERLAQQWAQESAEAQLNETLKVFGKKHFGGGEQSKRPARRVSLGRWWAAAAALVGILVIWLAWPGGDDALYEHYRKFPEAGFVVKSGEAQTLNEAAALFNVKNFDAALPILKAHLEQQPDDLEVRFFAGLCQLELGGLTEADSTFRLIISSGKFESGMISRTEIDDGVTSNAWSGEARWYLALTYLKEKKGKACAEILKEIPPGGAHYQEAQALLKRL
jgi:tetratricopeptide (TPR) repeat protein